MKRIVITIVMLIFGLNLYSQESNELSENEKKKIIEELSCFTECNDFILYVDAYVSLMELSFKSENLNFYVNNYNSFSHSRIDLLRPELLCAICNWKSREIVPVDSQHARVEGVFRYSISNIFGCSFIKNNSIKCELLKTEDGWKISSMENLIVINDYQNANFY